MATARTLRKSIVLVFAISSLVGSIQAQKNPLDKQVRWWRESWTEAEKTARDRNVPLMIVVIQDGEEANERLVDDILKTRELASWSNQCVPIICSRKSHGTVRKKVGNKYQNECRRFGWVSCDSHVDHESDMFTTFFKDGEVKTPQVMICKPDLTLVERIIDVAGVNSYVRAIKKAAKAMGPGFDRASYENAQVKITMGRNLVRQKKYREAWDMVMPVAAIGGKSRLVRQAKRVQDSINNHGDDVIKEAYACADKKDYWGALTRLDELSTLMKGTPPGDKAKSAFKRLQKKKPARKVASLLKKNKRLLPTYQDGRNHESKADYLKAHRTYERVAKKGVVLPVARKAIARLAFFHRDDDIRKLIITVNPDAKPFLMLRDAQDLKIRGKVDESKVLFRKVSDTYADTDAAKVARENL